MGRLFTTLPLGGVDAALTIEGEKVTLGEIIRHVLAEAAVQLVQDLSTRLR